MSTASRSVVAALVGAATVAAHGHVNNVIINGVSYAGYDVTSLPYMADPPVVVGWANSATDNGFVAPDAFGTSDIICHREGANAQGRAQVAAGDSVFLQWDTWPESHKGPVIDYLASCGSEGCASVDMAGLEFFKISEVGLVDGSGAPGTYGSDLLIANGNGWMVKIPDNIAPGQYVLRHEIIALHSGGQENGAQNYPQCINLEITGSGSDIPAGVVGTELYTSTDEGILFNIYTPLESYPVPGPALIDGASPILEQSASAAASTGTPTEGAGSGEAPAAPTDAPAPTSAPAAPTSAPEPTSAPAPAVTSSSAVATTAVTPSSTSAEAVEPTSAPAPPSTCATKKHKRSKKVRRHARDVKSRNVAPVRA